MKWEKRIDFEPAFDRRHPDPSKNYGIHGVTLRMVLIGPKGAVNFVLYTNWHLPHVTDESKGRIDSPLNGDYHWHCRPLPADLGYHSPKPMYEEHEPVGSKNFTWRDATEEEKRELPSFTRIPESNPTGTFTPCEYLDGKPCYYDGSSLNADRIYRVLLNKGSNGVWRELEDYYNEIFERKDDK